MTATLRRKRDPEGRRLAIISAAAELILEVGSQAVTHRMVAARACVPLGATTQYFATLDDLRDEALRHLSTEVDTGIEMIRHAIVSNGVSPKVLAGLIHGAQMDARAVQVDRAVATAAIHDPEFHGLAQRWFAEIVGFLAPVYGADQAATAAVFIDGVMWHAMMNDVPLQERLIESALAGLLGTSVTEPDPTQPSSVRSDREKPRV